MRIPKMRRSWSVEQQCDQLLDVLCGRGAFDEAAFLTEVAKLGSGSVAVARLPSPLWRQLQSVLEGHASGITAPHPGGWAILMPDEPLAAETTVLGHEAAHIVFGDVPHWDTCSSETQDALTAGFDHGDVGELSKVLSSISRRTCAAAPSESRAERLGALLTARVEVAGLTDRRPVDPIDGLLMVGEI